MSLFCLHRNVAASDHGRLGATSDLTPHESISAEHRDSVFVRLSRVEKITVPHVEIKVVVAERLYDLARTWIDLLHDAFTAERSFRQDGTFGIESYPAVLLASVLYQYRNLTSCAGKL
jgi:hypothetical protein